MAQFDKERDYLTRIDIDYRVFNTVPKNNLTTVVSHLQTTYDVAYTRHYKGLEKINSTTSIFSYWAFHFNIRRLQTCITYSIINKNSDTNGST